MTCTTGPSSRLPESEVLLLRAHGLRPAGCHRGPAQHTNRGAAQGASKEEAKGRGGKEEEEDQQGQGVEGEEETRPLPANDFRVCVFVVCELSQELGVEKEERGIFDRTQLGLTDLTALRKTGRK